MTIFGTATVWAKIAFLLIIIALALHIAGFATTFWEQQETIQEVTVYDIGLWKAQNCSGGHNAACDNVDIPDNYINNSFKAVRGFEIFVLVLIFITFVAAALYVASERFREMPVAMFITIMCFITVTFAVISMIIWLVQIPSNHYVGYSFGLCVVAFALMFLAGILMIPDIRNYQQGRGRQAMKVKPEHRPTPVHRPSKYDEVRGDYSYNKRFTPETPQTRVRHYYNPHRDSYSIRSPPPSYRTTATPEYHSGRSKFSQSAVQTPDVLLGRDGRKRY